MAEVVHRAGVHRGRAHPLLCAQELPALLELVQDHRAPGLEPAQVPLRLLLLHYEGSAKIQLPRSHPPRGGGLSLVALPSFDNFYFALSGAGIFSMLLPVVLSECPVHKPRESGDVEVIGSSPPTHECQRWRCVTIYEEDYMLCVAGAAARGKEAEREGGGRGEEEGS